jgi:hypothetical protein
MLKILNWLSTSSEKTLNRLAVLGSVLLALRLIQVQNGWVTDDTVLYFEVARLFALGGWQQGLALYQWPLYPGLLALLHMATGLSIHTAAQGLAIALFALTTASLIRLIRLAGGGNLIVACGALLLFGSQYIVGDILPMLIRDHGFWAFLLLSLMYFMQFYREGKWRDALLWQLAAIVAMLFRLEAITYLALLPLVLLAQHALDTRGKAMRMLQAYTLSLAAAATLAIALLTVPALSMADLGRLREIVALFEHNYLVIMQNVVDKARLMSEQVLGYHLREYGLQAVLLSLAMAIVFKVIQAAGWWTAALLFVKSRSEANTAEDARPVLYGAVAIAVLNAWLIILSTFILSSRYVISLALLLMLFAAFRMGSLLSPAPAGISQSSGRKWLGIFFVVLLGLGLVANLWPKKDSYNYEQEAVIWLKQHSEADSTVFYVSPRARYYAGAPYAGRGVDYWVSVSDALADGSIHKYDYLVINMEGKHTDREQLLAEKLVHHRFVKEFTGYRSKKKILIFSKAS